MYLPLARSLSRLNRTFSSSPTLAGVPFIQPFVGQKTLARVAVFCANANAVSRSEMQKIKRRTRNGKSRTELDMIPLHLARRESTVDGAQYYNKPRLISRWRLALPEGLHDLKRAGRRLWPGR